MINLLKVGFETKISATSARRSCVNGSFVFFFTFLNPYIVDPNHENQVWATDRLIVWRKSLSHKGIGECFQGHFYVGWLWIFFVCLYMNRLRSRCIISLGDSPGFDYSPMNDRCANANDKTIGRYGKCL
jgi:hypothetical protein